MERSNPRFAPSKPLAIVCSHPIQYYSPWFRYLANEARIPLKVLYLLEPPAEGLFDPGFRRTFKWDVSLLDGYESEFVPNMSRNPGTRSFRGLQNPDLSRRLRDLDPRAILLIGYNYWTLMRLIFAWAGPAPLLLKGDSHRLAAPRRRLDWARRAAITQVFRRIDAFLYVGSANRRYFLHNGVGEDRLFHSPHAVDNNRFIAEARNALAGRNAFRMNLGIPVESFVLVFAGKFEEKKRPLDLLGAFRAAGLTPMEASLLFVGDGPLESELRAAAQGMPHVHFIPFQNQSRMPLVYASGDVFVLPSYGPYETWGLAVNEAMCMGRPVLVSDHVGCAEDLVEDGVTGVVFRAGDVPALASAIRRVYQERSSVARWGEQARERVARFDYAAASNGLIRALDWLASDRDGERS